MVSPHVASVTLEAWNVWTSLKEYLEPNHMILMYSGLRLFYVSNSQNKKIIDNVLHVSQENSTQLELKNMRRCRKMIEYIFGTKSLCMVY